MSKKHFVKLADMMRALKPHYQDYFADRAAFEAAGDKWDETKEYLLSILCEEPSFNKDLWLEYIARSK